VFCPEYFTTVPFWRAVVLHGFFVVVCLGSGKHYDVFYARDFFRFYRENYPFDLRGQEKSVMRHIDEGLI